MHRTFSTGNSPAPMASWAMEFRSHPESRATRPRSAPNTRRCGIATGHTHYRSGRHHYGPSDPLRCPPRCPPSLPRAAPSLAPRQCDCGPKTVVCASSSSGAGGSSAATPSAAGAIHIRGAELQDYWPAADLHCQVFNADVSSNETFKALSLRADRVVSLQINDRIAREGGGNSALLLAFDGEAPATPEERAAAEAAFRAAAEAAASRESPTCAAFPHPMWWLGRPLAPGVRPGIGVSAQAVGLVGVAAVDSFCDLVPPRELDWRTDGQMGWYRREGYAYVSNVAVLPSARRRGVARQLMAAAEALAAEWGCRAVGLHCNPKKRAPWALYESLGYRFSGVVEPAFMPYLQGRPPDRCSFLVKLVPGWGGVQRAQRAGEGRGGGQDPAAAAAEKGAGRRLAA